MLWPDWAGGCITFDLGNAVGRMFVMFWLHYGGLLINNVSGARLNQGVGLLGAEVPIVSALRIFFWRKEVSPAKATGADSTRVPQNTYPVRSKHCNYRLYTFSYIVGLHCSCTSGR